MSRWLALSLALVALCFAVASTEQSVPYHGHRVFSIQVNNEKDANSVMEFSESLGLDVWTSRVSVPGTIDIRVSSDNIRAVMRFTSMLGLSVNVLHHDLGVDIDHERELNSHIQAANGGFFNSYATYDQMNTFLQYLQGNYSNISSLISIGKTIQGREILGIVISGNKNSSKPLPAIVINGCQHAREWISPMTVAYIAQSLCTNYSTDSTVKTIVDSFEWTIIPIVNADGYVYTLTDRMWRKNRRQNAGSSCIGVDNNRNWNFEWGTVGASPLACSDTFQGPSGFSEPEETAVANYISSKNGRVTGYIDYHSYGELWMSPWGYTKQLTPNNTVQQECSKQVVQAINAVHNQRFEYGPVYTTIYPASGGSNDWVYGAAGAVYAFACELRGNSFVLPPDQIIPSGQESFAGVKVMAQYILQNPQ